MADVRPTTNSRMAWPVALMGLGLFVFAIVALSGPGRIDVVEGQTRFEVGRSLVEHGDSVLRDDRVYWNRYPGRDGNDYSYDRLPSCAVAAGTIWVADATGPVDEGRRHFFYSLGGAVACGLLCILYAIWFRRMGCRPLSSLLWAVGGIFCMPMWISGTSTFDEYLGTLVLIAALLCASLSRGLPLGAMLTGALLGLAYNCHQPLAAFALVALALHDDPALPRYQRLLNVAYICVGLFAGYIGDRVYDHLKFPVDKEVAHAEQRALFGAAFGNQQLAAATVLTVSPAAGVLWYAPAMLLGLWGLAAKWRSERRLVVAVVMASIFYFAYVVSLSNFKGDPCWGPRHLVPLLGVLWLFAPFGASRMRQQFVAALLVLGLLVQVLGLAVDTHRLYVERDRSARSGRDDPWTYFAVSSSHLIQRPREIVEIARDEQPVEAYTPSPTPTFAFPTLDPPHLEERGPDAVRRYRTLNGLRPWWSSLTWLQPDDRPVPLGRTVAFLLWIAGVGLLLVGVCASRIEGQSPTTGS